MTTKNQKAKPTKTEPTKNVSPKQRLRSVIMGVQNATTQEVVKWLNVESGNRVTENNAQMLGQKYDEMWKQANVELTKILDEVFPGESK